jgi:hypothetical protein
MANHTPRKRWKSYNHWSPSQWKELALVAHSPLNEAFGLKKVKPMSKHSVFAIAASRQQADQMVVRLKGAGFFHNGLSALFPDNDSTRDLARERTLAKQRKEGFASVARTAWLAARRHGFASVGALRIGGVGPVVAAGPIIAALNDASVAGMVGVLINLGIPEVQAKRYESKIKEGNILIVVHPEDSDETARANEILLKTGGLDICWTGATSPKDQPATEYASSPSEVDRSPVRPELPE